MRDNLNRRHYGAALLALIEYEQPTEVRSKGLESLPGACYKSVTENVEQQELEKENAGA